VMVDLVKRTVDRLPARSAVAERLGVEPGHYAVLTIHRASNTDDPATFARLLEAAKLLPFPVVFPVHPRSRKLVDSSDGRTSNVRVIGPLPYRAMLALTRDARVILTDSGGLQKEAYVLGVPCVTLRTETEWVETLESGWNELTGSDEQRIIASALRTRPTTPRREHYGEGDAARRIVDGLSRELGDTGDDLPR
jgi:UDP-GlcNAc3NAcA epimerase